MSDVFSYTNEIQPSGQIASSDFARIAVGSGSARNALVQSCDVNYAQMIEEVTQVGSTQIYWLPGRPQGRVGVQSLVGSSGFFADWRGECGKIDTASVQIQGGRCGFNGGGSLFFTGGIVESVTANVTTGRQTISQGAQVRVASMSAS